MLSHNTTQYNKREVEKKGPQETMKHTKTLVRTQTFPSQEIHTYISFTKAVFHLHLRNPADEEPAIHDKRSIIEIRIKLFYHPPMTNKTIRFNLKLYGLIYYNYN